MLANGSWALPKRDVFNPNQKTWPETAERMGVRKTSKQKHSPVPIPGNMEWCIGAVKHRHSHKHSDPYSGGLRSSLHARPDAVSAATNELARATMSAPAADAPPATSPSAAVLAPPHASPSAVARGSSVQLFSEAHPSGPPPLAYPPSSAAPSHVFSRLSAALLRRAFPPPSTALLRHVFLPPSTAPLGRTFMPPSATGWVFR
jgi:hypothetical protein